MSSINETTLISVLDHSLTGKVIFDESGRLFHANSRARQFVPECEFDGRGRDALSLSVFVNFLHDHSIHGDESVKNTLSQTLWNEEDIDFREVIANGKGDIYVVLARRIAHNRTLFMLTDISRAKEREEHVLDLHRRNYRLQKAIQSATNGIIVADCKPSPAPLIFVNQSFCDFFGIAAHKILGRSLYELPQLIKSPELETEFQKGLFRANQMNVDLHKSKGDAQRWFSLQGSLVPDGRGKTDLFIGIFSETTDVKRREAEIFKAQKLDALGKLAGGVAHDFNNILSIIDGLAAIAAKDVPPSSALGESLSKIRAAAKRGAGITGKMLTFSRHKVVSKTVVNLSELIHEQAALLRTLITASIQLDVQIQREDLYVATSEDSISQILMNLVVNARDAMPAGGELKISANPCERKEVPSEILRKLGGFDFVKLSVTDTGIGMDSSIRQQIFDPFFTTKSPDKGTGLGLSIVYGLVSEMGGALDVSSFVGQGSTFTVYLPAATEESSRQISGNINQPESIRLKGVTVLVAEDEPILQDVVCKMLERMGARVLRACNGNMALLVQDEYEGDIDILLTDVVMPEMNGVKLASLLEALRPETRIIFMSGYPHSGDLAPVQVPDTALFVQKPVDYEQLASIIYKNMKRPTVMDYAGPNQDFVQQAG